MFAVLAALSSALCLAVASVLQHRAGHSGADNALRDVLRRPVWLVGACAGLLGFALHVLALSLGALSLVQPLLVTTLLFALPLSRALERRRIRPTDIAAAAAVVGGLALFQATAAPEAGRAIAKSTVLLGCVAGVLVLCAAALFVARRPASRASMLGLCAGAAYGLLAALMKSTVGVLDHDGLGVVSAWTLWAFLVIVTAAIIVNQLAFNAGPLASSLPLITIVDPLVSILVGAVAFGETTAASPSAILGQVIGFLAMSAGVLALARSSDAVAAAPSSPTGRPGTPAADLPSRR